ncbi:hypothetical protein [Sorangium sp. So ce1335]|uniref:hypothetical protein n=1 Tax=Sorangium sp. So ce1335 TaxID=3133335 RepID=UPI003F60A8B1
MAATALLSPWRAAAAPPRVAVELEVRRAPGTERCPGEELLREEMARQLGYDPVEPSAALQARTLIFRGPGREVHATLEIHDAEGAVTWSRHLVAYNDDCTELVMNMALSLRVALDPRLRVQPALDPALSPSAPPLPLSSPVEAAAELPPPAAGPDLTAGLALASVFGLLQDTTPGAGLHLALRYPSFSLGVEGSAQWPAEMKVDRGSVATWLATASAVPCTRASHLFACAFVSIGVVTTAATDVAINEASALWLATGPRAGFEMRLSRLFTVQAYGDIVLRLSEFRIETPTAVLWAPPAVGGLVGLRLDVSLSAVRGARPPRAELARGPWAPH